MMSTASRERYVFVIRLPRRIEIQIEDTFLILASATKPAMGYHITVLGPFHLRQGLGLDALDVVCETCRKRDPFAVRLAGLGAFEIENDNAVFLGVDPPQDLLALHDALLQATEALIVYADERARDWNTKDFCPHVTLGLGLTDQELEDFLDSGRQRPFDQTFEVARISLAVQEPNHAWEYVGDCAFGEERASPQEESYCRPCD